MNIAPRPPTPFVEPAGRMLRHAVIAGIATISLAACSSSAVDQPTPTASGHSATASPVTASPPTASIPATATVGPGTGTIFFTGSDPAVPIRFTMPAGWEADDWSVSRSDADPIFGMVVFDVGNIYADGCQWKLVDPPVGPTVGDLVSAYANVPGAEGAARDITVDGYSGKQIEYTVPNYDEDKCIEGKFGIFTEDQSGIENSPNLWAQTPRQKNPIRILDVNGDRLVILAGYPPNISAKDRSDLDKVLSSIEIG